MIIITLLILLILFKLLVIMMEMMILAVVEVILSIYDSLVEIWGSEVDSGRQFRILGVALVEYIDKRSIFGLGNSTIR